MTNREMLELAAKAVGREVWFDHQGRCCEMGYSVEWNPLTDDGDALRLASELNLSICYTIGGVNPTWGTVLVGFSPWNITNPIATARFQTHEEKMGTTRLAIVRAAAEIGGSME